MFNELINRVSKETTLLSKEEEGSLFALHQKGDAEATKRLIDTHLKLVFIISLEYARKHQPVEELFQEGVLGLHKALEKFDPSKDVRFRTYASCWVRKKMQEQIRENSRSVNFPSYVIDQLSKLCVIIRDLKGKHQETPTNAQIAEVMGLSEGRVEKLRGYLASDVQLDDGMEAGEAPSGKNNLHAAIPDIHQETASEHAIRVSDIKHLKKTLLRLTRKEQIVLSYRFGLDGDRERTLEETGVYMGVSTARVQQIEKKGVEKIKKYW